MPHGLTVAATSAVALAVGAFLLVHAQGETQRASASRGPITEGYPYARGCPAAGREKRVDRWLMYACNCTSYVVWALVANGQRTDWFEAGRMDAWQWPDAARDHDLPVGRQPTVGSVAVWQQEARPFGHLGYVTAVHSDGTFDVAEYNLPSPQGRDTFVFDRRVHVRRAGALFIEVPRLRGHRAREERQERRT